MTREQQEALKYIALGLREITAKLEADAESVQMLIEQVDSYRRQLDDLRGEMTPEQEPKDITARGLFS
jgi:hypothetical protein